MLDMECFSFLTRAELLLQTMQTQIIRDARANEQTAPKAEALAKAKAWHDGRQSINGNNDNKTVSPARPSGSGGGSNVAAVSTTVAPKPEPRQLAWRTEEDYKAWQERQKNKAAMSPNGGGSNVATLSTTEAPIVSRPMPPKPKSTTAASSIPAYINVPPGKLGLVLQLNNGCGAQIISMLPTSVLHKTPVRVGDFITKVDGTPVAAVVDVTVGENRFRRLEIVRMIPPQGSTPQTTNAKLKLMTKPISDVDVDWSSDVDGEVVSSIDANKKTKLMGEVYLLYSDRKKENNGAREEYGFFNEIILAAKTNTSIHDIVLTIYDKRKVRDQYAKSINAPSMAISVSEKNRIQHIRMGDAIKVAKKGYNRTAAEKRKAAGLSCTMQKLDSNGAKLQQILYEFETCYAGLKEFTLLHGHSDVPEDHPLYPICCQVRASFWSRAFGGKKTAWHNNMSRSSTLTKDQFILLRLLNFVWTKPPHNWREVTNSWEPAARRPRFARKTYRLDELFPGGL